MSANTPASDPSFPAFRELWTQLTPEERATVATAIRPELSNRQLARLSGVCVRQLIRYEGVRKAKAFHQARPTPPTHFSGRTRRPMNPPEGRGFSNPNRPGA